MKNNFKDFRILLFGTDKVTKFELELKLWEYHNRCEELIKYIEQLQGMNNDEE